MGAHIVTFSLSIKPHRLPAPGSSLSILVSSARTVHLPRHSLSGQEPHYHHHHCSASSSLLVMACEGALNVSGQSTEAPEAAAPSAVTLAGAAAAASPPTATQLRVQSILSSIKTQRSPTDAFMALMKLESRAMPQALQSKELDPRFNPRCCCWDTASVPPAWTADTVCERCTVLNELLGESCRMSRVVQRGREWHGRDARRRELLSVALRLVG